MIQRRTPLKRSTTPLKRTPVRRVGKKRAKQRGSYSVVRSEYLAAHPLCQITLHVYGIPEKWALAKIKGVGDYHIGYDLIWNEDLFFIPRATEIHHRNKCNGPRLTDKRWFMAVCREMHDKCESEKTWARERGYLLDISASPDGMTPSGVQGLTTDELMAQIK